jgi:hypothetical protein
MIGTTRQKPKILAAHRYIFAVNAPTKEPGFTGERDERIACIQGQ